MTLPLSTIAEGSLFSESNYNTDGEGGESLIIASANGVLATLLVILVGFAFANVKVFREHEADTVVAQYLKKIALPLYMFTNVVENFPSAEDFFRLFQDFPYALLICIAGLLMGKVLTILLKVQPGRRGLFTDFCGLTNVLFIGIPILTFLYGTGSSIATGMVYYMANTLSFWTVGTYLLARDGGYTFRFFSLQNLKRILTSPLSGLAVGVLYLCSGWQMPTFLETAVFNLAKTCGPLGLIMIGMVMRQTDLRKEHFGKDLAALFLIRCLLAPFVIGWFVSLLPLPTQAKEVFYLLSLMPGMTQACVMGKNYHSDYHFASTWVTISVIVSIVQIPAMCWLMEHLFHF